MLTKEEIEVIAEKAAERGALKALSNLGFTVGTDHDRNETRADMYFLRRQRRGSERLMEHARKGFLMTLIAAVSGAVLYWLGTGGHH